jgi:hypothetical protein
MKSFWLVVLSLQMIALELFAQVAASPVPGSVIPQSSGILIGGAPQGQWLLDIVAKFPKLSILIFIVGGLRVTLKPAFAFAHQFLKGWGLSAWDNAETAIETSKPMKVIYFILDYLGSVKMPVTSSDAPVEQPKV